VDASAGLRVKLLEASWEMFVNSHLLGVGFRGFGPTYREMNYVSQMAYVFEPHNMTYTVYAELGLIGLLIVGWLTYRVIKRAHLNIKDSDEQHPVHKALNMAVFCALIAYLVFYQFLGGAFNNNLFLLVCTLPFIIHKVQQKTVTSTT
jgi:O-antigen ligase